MILFVFRQDSSMSLFPSSSLNQIKKSMSDRPTSQSSELLIASRPIRASNSDIPTENSNKKSSLSFHLFDSILSRSSRKSMRITKNSLNQSSSLSCPPTSSTSNVQLPEQARCLYHYNAIQHDEISVQRGEYVQIINIDQDNRWFVRRHTNRTSMMNKGWLPGFVLGLKDPNSPRTQIRSSATTSLPTSSMSSNNLDHL